MQKMKTIQELVSNHECVKCILLLEVDLAINKPPIVPGHCPTAKDLHPDKMLCQPLEDYTGRYFYESCDRYTQSLLSSCEWYITTNTSALTLIIDCPDPIVNWRVLKNIVQIGSCLKQLTSNAKIRVCPPPGTGTAAEIRVDELSVYENSLQSDPNNFFLAMGVFS